MNRLIEPAGGQKKKSLWENGRGSSTNLVLLAGMATVLMVVWAAVLWLSMLWMSEMPAKPARPAPPPLLVCYYNAPANRSEHELHPYLIPSRLCTHINIAFARIVDNEIQLDESQINTISQVVKLKLLNPDLKVLLSIGGSGADGGFINMVGNHDTRKTFIKSIKRVLTNYSLDGVDLDWEYPVVHKIDNKYLKVVDQRERQHFTQLLREIRVEYLRENKGYLLTVAVAASPIIVDAAYDVDLMNMYPDFVNIMTYDYHFYYKYTPFTGLNAPLFARRHEESYLAQNNINFTLQLYINKGLSPEKILLGIPTYGHTFTLVNPDNAQIGSPASGVGKLGSGGFVNYPDVCLFKKEFSGEINETWEAGVPYLSREHEWVSYDSTCSVLNKVAMMKHYGLRGVMVYSLNADDFMGICNSDAYFPLVKNISRALQMDRNKILKQCVRKNRCNSLSN